MRIDITDDVKRVFDNIGPRNPLRRLTESDRRLLTAMLFLYKYDSLTAADWYAPLETAGTIASDAGELAARIRREVIEGKAAQVLSPFIGSYKSVAEVLERFSKQMKIVFDSLVGRPGHKSKIGRNQFLVMASEFVRLTTGSYYDEHLAELFQAVHPSADLKDEISGEAILKKRKHLMRSYPLIHAHLMKKVHVTKTCSEVAGGPMRTTPDDLTDE
jgi:hypothetical protein